MNHDIKKMIDNIHIQGLNGRITIGDLYRGLWSFHTKFYTKLEKFDLMEKDYDFPTFDIPNYDVYLEKVEKYLKYAQQFYKEDQKYYGLSDDAFLQKLYLDLIVSSTYFQQHDIIEYVEMRTKMLKNKFAMSTFKIGSIINSDIISTISKNRSNLEAPYNFVTKLKNGNNEFEMPKIVFGAVDNTIHIYAIQNKKQKQDSSFAKKADRYLRKVNKGVQEDTIEANVSSNALVALTIFLSWGRECGYSNIIVPEFLPIRYDANLNAALNRGYSYKERCEIQEIANRNQFNMTNKLLYTMYRYNLHFNESQLFYDDVKGQVEMKIKKQKEKNDNIIFTIDEFVDVSEYKSLLNENQK